MASTSSYLANFAPSTNRTTGFDLNAWNADNHARNASNAYNQTLPDQEAYQQMVANQQGILGNSQQRLNEVRADPMDALFKDAVKKQLDTKGLETALFSQSSDMSTAADNQRQSTITDQIARRGGSLNDPSAQAALAASTSQRQGDQQRNARDATLAGYQQGAQGLGAGLAYSGQRNSQLNQATGMVNNALSMPVTKRPYPTINGGPGSNEGMDAAVGAAKPTGVGFNTSKAPTYNDWLASQKKA